MSRKDVTLIWCRAQWRKQTPRGRTFLAHAHSKALLQTTVLTLVPVMHVDWTVAVAATCVREVATYGALEKTLATFACELQRETF